MARTSRVREFAFILILAYCIAWGIKAAKSFVVAPLPKPLTTGEHFSLEDMQSTNDRVLVLATSAKCPYCQANQKFHKRLIDAAHRLRIPLVVATDTRSSIPQDTKIAMGTTDRVIKGDLTTLRILGTPTILLVEREKVTGIWIGQMNSAQQEGLLSRLDGSFHTLTKIGSHPQILSLNAEVLRIRLRQSQVLDIRSRDEFRSSHLDSAVNIPADELSARMQVELGHDGRPIVIDCTSVDMDACRLNAELLEWGGLTQVWLLDAGAVGAACSRSPV